MLTILEVKNPRWSSPDGQFLDVDVLFEEYQDLGLMPFTANATADTTQGLEIWKKAKSGAYGPIAPYVEPVREPPVIQVPAVLLWERLTEAEAEQVNAAMATQPFRTRQIFLTANTFRSDHELWPLLQRMAIDLFGEERAVQLLGGVDEFEPLSCGSNMNHADEALGELVVSSSNGAVDFQSAKHPFD